MGEYPPCEANNEVCMDRKLQVAHLLFRCRCILESCWRWPVRLSHQSAHCFVLRSRAQPYAGSRPHRSVWRIRNVGPWADALLFARTQARSQVEARAVEVIVLVSKPRSGLRSEE